MPSLSLKLIIGDVSSVCYDNCCKEFTLADFERRALFELELGELNSTLHKFCGPRFVLFIVWFFILAIIIFTVVILLS
jgi:uncharacterized protein YqhQ